MSDNWSTPDELFEELHEEFNFNLDVCAEAWNHKCFCYFTEYDDGLKQSWFGTVWMNPPYSDRNLEKWIRKAYDESKKGITVVALIPNNKTETKYFQKYCIGNEFRYIEGRIHFSTEDNYSGRPRFGSMLVIFRKEIIRSVGPSPKYKGGN